MRKFTLKICILGVIISLSLPVSAQTSTFTDTRDGKTYRTVKIGNKTWMAENLNLKTKFSRCYENKEDNCQKYGQLYDLSTAMIACPAGWRLPNDEDWHDLVQAAGGTEIAGKSFKSKTGWKDGGNGRDEFDFSALPGGIRNSDGGFSALGSFGYWWSATPNDSEFSDVFFYMSSSNESVDRDAYDLNIGFSVRCIQDKRIPTTGYILDVDGNPIDAGFGGAGRQPTGIVAGKPIKITAYPNKYDQTFVNWTVKSGQAKFADANSATTMVTLNSSATIVANFKHTPLQPLQAGGQFNPDVKYSSITDLRDNKKYRTIKIGKLTWMAENLNHTVNNSWCYDNDTSNCEKYGRLYNWNAAMSACPAGWRLPDTTDFSNLRHTAGSKYYTNLKSKIGWTRCISIDESGESDGRFFDCNANGTDVYGFSALPGGSRHGNGDFSAISANGIWWGATEYGNQEAHPWATDQVLINNDKSNGFSVRCVQGNKLLVNPNPTTGGTVTPTSQINIGAGTPIKITAVAASGHKFVNWTVTNGQAQLANANSATTTVTLSSSATITANFQLQPGGQFNPSIKYSSFKDSRDGQSYRTVKIGDRTWMAENLNHVTPNSWCYDNSTSNCALYGRLYTWNAVKNACPDGWVLPTSNEWNDLIRVVGGDRVAGKMLKSKTSWDQTGNGTDVFGFSAVPSGRRDKDGNFLTAGLSSYWWASTQSNFSMHHNNERVESGNNKRGDVPSYSIRCIQDNTLTVSQYPIEGGTVTPALKTYFVAGTPVNITATAADGYTFINWTLTRSRQAQIADAKKAATTVTLSSSARVTANFLLQPGKQFNPEIKYSSFTDSRDNQNYRTVRIGNLTWMAENLNYKADSSWCYNNDSSYCATYGRLYTWDAATSACPTGWRLPDSVSWDNLTKATGNLHIAGTKLKSKKVFSDYFNNGTDDFGFSAIYGGQRNDNMGLSTNVDFFTALGTTGSWWSATVRKEGNAQVQIMNAGSQNMVVHPAGINKRFGNSVRCVQE